jgi:nucleoside 2-deoxyribosyltransferase
MRREDIGVYLAAPLFNERERAFNACIAGQIESHVNVFLPQRDGALLVDMLRAGVPHAVAERRIFEQDTRAMRSASALIAILDGGHIDEGVAFEVGFMNALGRPCVGLQTDVRRALPSGNNPMIAQGLDVTVDNVSDLLSWVADFVEQTRVANSLRA